eukprot:20076-Pyramimonas_sp.AAC.1
MWHSRPASAGAFARACAGGVPGVAGHRSGASSRLLGHCEQCGRRPSGSRRAEVAEGLGEAPADAPVASAVASRPLRRPAAARAGRHGALEIAQEEHAAAANAAAGA